MWIYGYVDIGYINMWIHNGQVWLGGKLRRLPQTPPHPIMCLRKLTGLILCYVLFKDFWGRAHKAGKCRTGWHWHICWWPINYWIDEYLDSGRYTFPWRARKNKEKLWPPNGSISNITCAHVVYPASGEVPCFFRCRKIKAVQVYDEPGSKIPWMGFFWSKADSRQKPRQRGLVHRMGLYQSLQMFPIGKCFTSPNSEIAESTKSLNRKSGSLHSWINKQPHVTDVFLCNMSELTFPKLQNKFADVYGPIPN